MNTVTQIGIALTIAVLATTGASAQTKKYGSEAGWDIFIDEKMGPGCLVSRKLSADAQVLMGIDATADRRGYLALYTKADANVGAGEKLSVLFDVDGQKFTGEATGQQMEGFRGAYVPVNNPDFIFDLAKRNKLTITPDGSRPDSGKSRRNRCGVQGFTRLPRSPVAEFGASEVQDNPWRHSRCRGVTPRSNYGDTAIQNRCLADECP